MLNQVPSVVPVSNRPATQSVHNFWPSFIHPHSAAIQECSVQGCNCQLSVRSLRHFYKSKTPRLASVAILHYGDSLHHAVGREQSPQLALSDVEIQVADKNIG
jgi:hypothetical protein